MYRKKHSFVHSILFRISFWILMPGIVGMLFTAYFVRIQMQYHIERQITEEMQRVRDNSLLYVRQTLLLNDSRVDAAGFAQYREEIARQLKGAGYREVFLCDPDGELLAGEEDSFETRRAQEDFMQAQKQAGAFTVHYGSGGQCQVYFSMPVIWKEQPIGIISSTFDYGELYGGQLDTIRRMIGITVAVFLLICLVIWFTVYRILSPIRSLSRAANEISAHLTGGQQGSAILGKLQMQGRKDEIGELYLNDMEMLRVIEEQFQKIQEDRNRILALWSSRQEFYNNVTHELKTPLTTISGFAQLMEKNGPGDEDLFYIGTEHILRESTRLHRMVVQLLELQNRTDMEEVGRLDLAQILKSVCETMGIKAGRYGNTLVTEGINGLFPVLGKEDRIRQVLINIIDNAIKYGEPGKPILIRIAVQGEPGKSGHMETKVQGEPENYGHTETTGQENQDGWVRITVSNQGQGIRQEELETIFEPFYRVDKGRSRELGSSGLGLSIVARIMKEHGGGISADSIPGGTTTFTVCFPTANQYIPAGNS